MLDEKTKTENFKKTLERVTWGENRICGQTNIGLAIAISESPEDWYHGENPNYKVFVDGVVKYEHSGPGILGK